MESFWKNKPLITNNNGNYNIIFNKEILENIINNDITSSKLKLDYIIIKKLKDHHVEFINRNYDNGEFSLYYSKELIEFFCGDQWIGIEFYPTNNTKMIGFVIINVNELCIKIPKNDKNIIQKTCEINFLSLDKKLRNIHLSNYIINVITKETINEFDIINAIYTVGKELNTCSFSEKEYYHISLQYSKLLDTSYQLEYKNSTKEDNWNDNVDIKKLYKYEYRKFKIFHIKTPKLLNIIDNNDKFHQFYDKYTDEYLCLFRLDSVINETKVRSGYVYMCYVNCKTTKLLEKVVDYCKKNDIFDTIITTDFNESSNLNYYLGSGVVYHYFYNADIFNIKAIENGLVTI